MKRISEYTILFFGMFTLLMMLLATPTLVYGQKDEQKKEQKQKKARIQLDYYNINGQEYTVKATVKTKDGRSYVTVPGVPVNISISSEDDSYQANLGEIVSDEGGVAQVTGKISDLPSSGSVIFKAAITASKEFKKYSKKLEVRNAIMDVRYVTVDSVNEVIVRCYVTDTAGQDQAISGLDIKVYVERLFGELGVATEYNKTDDDGEVSIAFPATIHGDYDGKLNIVVRVEDHDDYGNLVNKKEMEWGIPLVQVSNGNGRLLWAGQYKAPIPLVIMVNSVLTIVWGAIFYILLNILKIFRLGKDAEPAAQA